MRYGFICSMPQFWDHMLPIHEGLPEEERGPFIMGRRPVRIVGNIMRADPRDDPAHGLSDEADMACVASIADLKRISVTKMVTTMNSASHVRFHPRMPTVLFEHGVGFSFAGDTRRRRQASYAGGYGRENILALPAPNRWVSEPNLRAYPNVPSPIVGCPKLDVLTTLPPTGNARPLVCVAFHWDCKVAPETRWAWPYYEEAVAQLAKRADAEGFDLVAHGHPRERPLWRRRFPHYGIPFIEDFAEVCERADVYVNDSSSTLYEFAATGRPVVVLNAPWYRRRVHHGLRFWDYADVGLNVNSPEALLPIILRTIADDPQAEVRAAAIAEIYPYLGRSVPRTIEVLHDLYDSIPRRQRGR